MQFKCGKTRTRENAVFGYFSRCAFYFEKSFQRKLIKSTSKNWLACVKVALVFVYGLSLSAKKAVYNFCNLLIPNLLEHCRTRNFSSMRHFNLVISSRGFWILCDCSSLLSCFIYIAHAKNCSEIKIPEFKNDQKYFAEEVKK